MFTLNEDAKAKLQDKISAVVGDEELDKVAGGTYKQNLEILDALKKIDPDGVDALFDSLTPGNEKGDIADGTMALIKKNLGIAAATPTNFPNYYENKDSVRIEGLSHATVLEMIDKKAKGKL